MSEFKDYVDESLKPMEDQARIHTFSNDFSELLKKHNVTIADGHLLFRFGGGWFWGIDRRKETEDNDE